MLHNLRDARFVVVGCVFIVACGADVVSGTTGGTGSGATGGTGGDGTSTNSSTNVSSSTSGGAAGGSGGFGGSTASVSSGGGAGGAAGAGGAGGDAGATSSSSSGGLSCTTALDCPPSATACMIAACVAGACVTVPAPMSQSCNGTCHCNGFGSCAGPGCITDAICPMSPDPCLLSKCVGCEECAFIPKCKPDQTCTNGVCSP
jgi:hypothetical protein